jgi:tetratricopeptide (TPR) repeat protein
MIESERCPVEVASGNEQLRELLVQTGMTHDAFARSVNRVAAEHGALLRTNKSSVTHWLKGVQPNPRTVAYVAEALSRRLGRRIHPVDIGNNSEGSHDLSRLPDDPVTALAMLGRADVDRRQVLGSVVYSLGALLLPISYKRDMAERARQAARGGAIGWSEVEAVRDVTAAFNRADEKLGGGFGRTAVVEYLATDVTDYCRARSSEPVRTAVLGEAAQLAYLAGWKAHDLKKEGLAQRYYLHSYQLAKDSGDDGQAAYAMRILAHQAYDMGHVTNCAALAGAAVDRVKGRVDKHTEAVFGLTLAKAQAMQGDRRNTVEAIGRAESLMAHAGSDDERPAWAGMHSANASQFHNHVAKVLADLGDYAGAEEHFAQTLGHHLDPDTKPRIYALTAAWLAETQCRRGHVERACQTWAGALARMNGIQSSRTVEAINTMRQMLASFHQRGMPEVKKLLEEAATIRAESIA